VLERIPAGTFYDFGKQVFPGMLEAGAEFYGMRQDAYWCDIGTPGEYRRVHRDALEGRVQLTPPQGARIAGGVLIGAGTRVSPSASIAAPSCIGSACQIDDDASIASSILWQRVSVGARAHIEGAVIASEAAVAPGASIRGGEYGKAARIE
jgi:mannose-1-phosphate guanylyltransferase